MWRPRLADGLAGQRRAVKRAVWALTCRSVRARLRRVRLGHVAVAVSLCERHRDPFRDEHREQGGEGRGGMERKVGDLTTLGRELRQIIGQCGRGTVAECRIIEALSPA